jgi:hypothetical protein
MDERFDTDALRRLRLRWWPVLAVLALNVAVLIPILCDPQAWAVRVYHALPPFLRIVRSGEYGEEIVHLLDWVCLPLYLLTLGVLFLGRWRMCRDLVRDLELIPEGRRLQFRVLWPPGFWIALTLLVLPLWLAFLWIWREGCGPPLWPFGMPAQGAVFLLLVHLECVGKLSTRTCVALMALTVFSMIWDPTEVLWFFSISVVGAGVPLVGMDFLMRLMRSGKGTRSSPSSEGTNSYP